jgi:hypothetical protein
MFPDLRLNYRVTESGESVDYTVRLQTTRPQFGGVRWWSICSLVSGGRACGRRAQRLYLPPNGKYFGCRNCYDLSYASRSYRPLDRSRERARAIRLLLGGSASFLDPFPLKPKGMWWKTYIRLRREYDWYDNLTTVLDLEWFAKLKGRCPP